MNLTPPRRRPLKLKSLFSSAVIVFALIPAGAHASDIVFNATLTASSPTQLGRLVRNAVQQTWTGAEPYPGINNATTRFSYQTYTFAGSLFTGANYLEISAFDTLNTNSVFISAYAGTYNPASIASGWLGDEGSSGNYFGVDPIYFDVFLPFGQNLTIVANSSAAAGLNDPINIVISSYGTTAYGDAIPTPEPSGLALLGTGLLGVVGVVRSRIKAKVRS